MSDGWAIGLLMLGLTSLFLSDSSRAVDTSNSNGSPPTIVLIGADGMGYHALRERQVVPRTLYVDAANTSAIKNGASWETAFATLTGALKVARDGDQIWVAKGTYQPTDSDDRNASFVLKEGVELYGGFAKGQLRLEDRDWKKNQTILSGDIGRRGDDSDNVFHVVINADRAVLDGFTVTGGNGSNAKGGGREVGHSDRGPGSGGPPSGGIAAARGARRSGGPGGPGGPAAGAPAIHITPQIILAGINPGTGAGIVNYQCAPTIRNCIIRDNKARKGAGAYNMVSTVPPWDASFRIERAPTFINCSFINNYAVGRGGGVSNDLGTYPTFIRCSFLDNRCDGKGGAVYNDFHCSPTFQMCLFVGNSAFDGGAMGNDGSSSPTITNCTFTRNHAIDMGAALYQGSGPSNDPIVTNAIIWGNRCDNGPAEIVNWHDNSPQVTHSCIEGGYPGEGNVDEDPRFVDPENGDFRLAAGSPCIDRANGLVALLRDRHERDRFDDTGAADGPLAALVPPMGDLRWTAQRREAPADIGAFERQQVTPATQISVVYVDDDNKHAVQDGRSWGTAFSVLQPAIELAYAAGAEVWVAAGTYTPTDSRDRTISIQLRNGVSLYGGFSGTEPRRDERAPERNVCTLSGDIGHTGDHADNSYHVLIGANEASLDGFRIVHGNADGQGYHAKGGGMVNYARHAQKAPTGWATGYSVRLSNCEFSFNHAKEGGAIYNYDRSEPVLENVVFRENRAESGGAIVDRMGVRSQFTRCTFSDNYAKWRGGAVYFDYGSRPLVEHCQFARNRTDGHGAATYIISRASQLGNTIATIRSSTFTENVARLRGGAVANADSGILHVTDCEFSQNQAGRGGGAISNEYLSRSHVRGTTFNGNSSKTGKADVDTDATSLESFQ